MPLFGPLQTSEQIVDKDREGVITAAYAELGIAAERVIRHYAQGSALRPSPIEVVVGSLPASRSICGRAASRYAALARSDEVGSQEPFAKRHVEVVQGRISGQSLVTRAMRALYLAPRRKRGG